MKRRILPHKREGYIEKPFNKLSPEERAKRIRELAEVETYTTTEQRHKALMELRGKYITY